MKKKGAVYRLTMLVGAGIIVGQTFQGGSYSYWQKDTRNLEIKADKKTEAKMNELTTDEDGQEESSSFGILKSR